VNRLILPAPLATLLVTRQPCTPALGHCCFSGCDLMPCGCCRRMMFGHGVERPMVAQWVTQPEPCPYVGERVEFVADCDCPTSQRPRTRPRPDTPTGRGPQPKEHA